MTFVYTPWTPPAKDTTGQAGAQKKANIHEAGVIANLDTDTWAQFVIPPANTDPNDPYNGSLNAHARDLARSAKANDVNVSYQFYKVLPDGTDERWFKTKDKPDVMDDGAPTIVRFNARRKKLI